MSEEDHADGSELQLFISESLKAVMQGIGETRGKASLTSFTGLGEFEFNPPKEVEFDIAVTAENSGTARGGFKISVLGIGANAQGDSTSKATTVSRIKFSVPTKFKRERGYD